MINFSRIKDRVISNRPQYKTIVYYIAIQEPRSLYPGHVGCVCCDLSSSYYFASFHLLLRLLRLLLWLLRWGGRGRLVRHHSLSQLQVASGRSPRTTSSTTGIRKSTYGGHRLQPDRLIATGARRHQARGVRGQRRVLHPTGSLLARRCRAHAQQLELAALRL